MSQLPAHGHSFTTSSAGEHSHSYTQVVSGCAAGSPCSPGTAHHAGGGTTGAAGNHSHSGTTDDTGESALIENRPAYYEIAFIMRI